MMMRLNSIELFSSCQMNRNEVAFIWQQLIGRDMFGNYMHGAVTKTAHRTAIIMRRLPEVAKDIGAGDLVEFSDVREYCKNGYQHLCVASPQQCTATDSIVSLNPTPNATITVAHTIPLVVGLLELVDDVIFIDLGFLDRIHFDGVVLDYFLHVADMHTHVALSHHWSSIPFPG